MDKSAYLSSTYQDLRPHREAVYRVLAKMRFRVTAMEDYVARDDRMVGQVVKDVAACDIYVGIFAWRYGYIPPDGNPQRLSVTVLEYREAEKLTKPRLLFLLDATAACRRISWTPTRVKTIEAPEFPACARSCHNVCTVSSLGQRI